MPACKCVAEILQSTQEATQENQEIYKLITGHDTELATAFADVGQGLTHMADQRKACCEDAQTFQKDTYYAGYPRVYTDAEGKEHTSGPVADYNAYLHKSQDNRFNIADREMQIRKDGYDTGKALAAIVAVAAALKYLDLFPELEAVIEDTRKAVDPASKGVQTLTGPAVDAANGLMGNVGTNQGHLETAGADSKARGDESWAHWVGAWKPQEETLAALSGPLGEDAVTAIKAADAFFDTLATEAKAHYDAAYKAGDEKFSAAALDAAACAVERICEVRDWIFANAQKIEGFWDGAYKAHTQTLNASTTQGGTDGVAATKRSTDTLHNYSAARKAYYDSNYAGGEGTLAGRVLADGATQSNNAVQDHDYMVSKARTRNDYYDSAYAPGETGLADTTLQEAITLVDKLSDVFDWLSQQGDDMQAFWDSVYKAAEAKVAPILINRGGSMSDFSEELVRRIDEFAKDMRSYWDDVYRAAEAAVAPVIINNGDEASDQIESSYEFFEQRYKDLWDHWNTNWYPCDVKDLKFHCDMWDKHNMLEDIKSNADLARRQADVNWDAHSEHGLPCETKRLDEICAMPVYEPQYCEVEGKAVLHVRAKMDKAKEEAIRCTGRHCVGAAEYQIEQLNIQSAAMETAALQAAHRYEKWWYVQEENRRHRYHQDIFSVSEKWPDNVLNSLRRSSDDNDRIVADIHQRIVRGYEYLKNMQDAGRSTLQGASDAVRYAIETIRVGHFFPQIFLDGEKSADGGSRDNVRMAIATIEQGHYFPKIAQSAKQIASAIAEATGKLGERMIELGHFHPRLAAQLMEQSSTNAARGTGHGIDMARVGHQHFQQAGTDSYRSGQLADSAVARAIAALQAGPQYARLAADKAHMAAQQSLSAWQNGNFTVQNGMKWAALSHNVQRDRRQAAGQELRSAFDSLRIGQMNQTNAQNWTRLQSAIFSQLVGDALRNASSLLSTLYNGGANMANSSIRGSEVGLQQTAGIINGALAFYGQKSVTPYTGLDSSRPPAPVQPAETAGWNADDGRTGDWFF